MGAASEGAGGGAEGEVEGADAAEGESLSFTFDGPEVDEDAPPVVRDLRFFGGKTLTIRATYLSPWTSTYTPVEDGGPSVHELHMGLEGRTFAFEVPVLEAIEYGFDEVV